MLMAYPKLEDNPESSRSLGDNLDKILRFLPIFLKSEITAVVTTLFIWCAEKNPYKELH